MYTYSTDRTHIRVCSIVGVFAELLGGGFPTGFHEQMRGFCSRHRRPTALFGEIFCCIFGRMRCELVKLHHSLSYQLVYRLCLTTVK